jgi:23S rRNA (uridine2552-2'-O)-methyltransferase
MRKKPREYARADHHTRAARALGYPARSVFKLEEIQNKYRLLRPGQRVLDLGAAPGSWSLYASQCVGSTGRVLAVDLSEIDQAMPPNVLTRVLDVFSAERASLAEFGPYDVVLSDMAPHTSGNKARDQALSYELCVRALAVADDLADVGSHFVAKLFMSADFTALKRALVERYAECRVVRPNATRSQSSEVFLVGLRKKPPAPPSDAAGGTPVEHP